MKSKKQSSFVFRRSRASSQAFSTIKTKPDQNKTKHIPPNLSKKGVLNKQHPALV